MLEDFKSFKGRLVIPLFPGYTGITGPNGSGKSNISDAVLFVLGPKSSRVLRAGKQSELIYDPPSGGRKPSSCSVSLHFDNTNREFPIPDDEVVLTRTVRRSATDPEGYTSYFYLNGRRSSLTEFESLLAHARISADSYNIVQQGDIMRIVQMTPVERRRILDSIAGITKYDEEIEQAEKKMEEVKNDIERIHVLMDEIRSRITQLEQERVHALEYKRVKDELDMARAQMAYRDVVMGLEEKKSMEKEIERCGSEIASLEKTLEENNRALKDIECEISRIEEEISSKLGDEFKKVKEALDGKKLEKARKENAIENIENALKKKGQEIDELRERLKGIQGSIESRRKTLKHLNDELEGKKKRESCLKGEIDALTSEAEGSSAKIRKAGEEVRNLEKEISAITDEIRSEELEKEKIGIRCQEMEKRRGEIEERVSDLEFELKDYDYNMKEIMEKAKKQCEERNRLVEEFHTLRARKDALEREIENLSMEIKGVEREYDAVLRDAQKGDDRGYNPGVGAILDAGNRGLIKGIHGTVMDLITPEEGFEDAVIAAGQQRLNAIVVDDDACASECIEFLKKGKKGRCRFLPLNKMIGGKPRGKALAISGREGVLGFLTEHIRYDPKYENAIWDVFGDTVVCSTLENARALMGGVRLVTLSGELIEPSCAMIGGSLGKQTSQKGRLDALGKRLKEMNEILEKKQSDLKSCSERLREVENRIQEINISEGHLDPDKVKAGREEHVSALKKAREELESIEKDIENLRKEHEALDTKVREGKSLLDSKKERYQELKKVIEESMSDEMSKKLNALKDEYMRTIKESGELSARIAGEQAALESEEKESNAIITSLKNLEEDVESLKKEKDSIFEAIKLLEDEVAQLEAKINEWTGKCDQANKEKDERIKKRYELQGICQKLVSEINVKKDRIVEVKTRLSTEIEEKIRAAQEAYAAIGIEVKEPLPTLREIKRAISDGEEALKAIGNVNLKAIEEYDAQSRRYADLQAEVKRLEEERQELSTLRKEIEGKKKDGLLTVFKEIDKNFRAIYPIFSDGENGYLELENPESPFDGGLLMRISASGTGCRRIEAMSGGQKSLAALAFIFALQQYTPSQFYILDEVDMFLDAINAETVARTIKQNSSRAQFIQISLRKVTLNWVDHIIGVYHKSDGCSQVIIKPNIEDEVSAGELTSGPVVETDGGGSK